MTQLTARLSTNDAPVTYTYDGLGNRLVQEASEARTTYACDPANQLGTSEDASGTTTDTYDLAGNLHLVEEPSGDRTTTTWEDQNRQTCVVQPDGGITTCTYRFDGLRKSKEDSIDTTAFIWDFENYLAEADADNEIQAVYTEHIHKFGDAPEDYRYIDIEGKIGAPLPSCVLPGDKESGTPVNVTQNQLLRNPETYEGFLNCMGNQNWSNELGLRRQWFCFTRGLYGSPTKNGVQSMLAGRVGMTRERET